MKRIDGGDGGGQLLRWALAMASLAGTPIRIENIRGARDTPGLRPQHVAAVRAAERFTGASVEGIEVGSTTITFEPRDIRGGTGSIDVGTAGSVPLVFDTILPFCVALPEPLSLTATGGTDVRWSPPIDFHRLVKCPVLESAGFDTSITVNRRGFYPKGGGKATLRIDPSTGRSLDLTTRGALEEVEIVSVATADLESAAVAERQATTARDEVAETSNIERTPAADSGTVRKVINTTSEYVAADSTGTVILVAATYENTVAGFSALGEAGKPAETVADEAVASWQSFHDSSAAVDPHLADQLLPFLALLGGRYTTPAPTTHIETAISLLTEFGYEIDSSSTPQGLELSAPEPTLELDK